MADAAPERPYVTADELVARIVQTTNAAGWDFKSRVVSWNHDKATDTLTVKFERSNDLAQLQLFEG